MLRTRNAGIACLGILLLSGLFILPASGISRLADAQELDQHPAHTHSGTCAQPGAIVSTLSPVSNAYVVDGEAMVVPEIAGSAAGIPVEYSSTTLPVSLSQILAGQFIIDVKVSEEDQLNSVACGEIGGLMLGTTDLPIGLVPVNGSGHYGTAWLHENEDGTVNVFHRIDRSGKYNHGFNWRHDPGIDSKLRVRAEHHYRPRGRYGGIYKQ